MFVQGVIQAYSCSASSMPDLSTNAGCKNLAMFDMILHDVIGKMEMPKTPSA